jgi:hypothetical protein
MFFDEVSAMSLRFVLSAVAVLSAIGSGFMEKRVTAEEWGHLKGQFVLEGKVPDPAALVATRDAEFCGKHQLVDESLVIGKEGGIANVVVALAVKEGAPLAIHDSYAATATGKVALDNDKCRYEPRVAVLRTSQTLVIGNRDTVGHNTKIDLFANLPINVLVPAGGELAKQFPLVEPTRIPVGCSIHPWMRAWLVVKDHPYVAVSGADGRFEIKNLPAGKWVFQLWQEQAGYVNNIRVGASDTVLTKGNLEVTIAAGDNDLGAIKVQAANFAK